MEHLGSAEPQLKNTGVVEISRLATATSTTTGHLKIKQASNLCGFLLSICFPWLRCFQPGHIEAVDSRHHHHHHYSACHISA